MYRHVDLAQLHQALLGIVGLSYHQLLRVLQLDPSLLEALLLLCNVRVDDERLGLRLLHHGRQPLARRLRAGLRLVHLMEQVEVGRVERLISLEDLRDILKLLGGVAHTLEELLEALLARELVLQLVPLLLLHLELLGHLLFLALLELLELDLLERLAVGSDALRVVLFQELLELAHPFLQLLLLPCQLHLLLLALLHPHAELLFLPVELLLHLRHLLLLLQEERGLRRRRDIIGLVL
mmetsp:Transcript_13244/g.31205  ORF Transcript_13244/g.31205 Transcript_13244/m.31205 type:complete len:238 (+) Transcript_13244:194-907(+)